MANTVKVRRGTFATLPTLEAGEIAFATDTYQVFVGDGVANHRIGMLPIDLEMVTPPFHHVTGHLLSSNGGTGTSPSKDGQLLIGTDIVLGSSHWDVLDPPADDALKYLLQVIDGAITWGLSTAIDHNTLTNYSANKHIDHTGVTLTAGVGLSGGGDISSNRTFTFDATELESVTWGGGAQASIVHTFNVSGTDTTMTYGDGIITASCPLNATTGFRIGNTAVAGKILVGDGTNFITSTPKYPNASATAGKVIRSDGTDYAASTFTIPDTMAINTLLYASSANILSALATGNNGVLVTGAGGIPAISTTLPNGLTFGTLGANWDIGDNIHLVTDTVMARDAAGLELFEDGGKGLVVHDSDGYVGWNIAVPLTALHIHNGVIRITSTQTNTYLLQGFTPSGGGNLAIAMHYGNTTSSPYLWIGVANDAWSGPFGTNVIASSKNAGTTRPFWIFANDLLVPSAPNLYLAVNSNNVGINTITPSARLAINGGLHVGGDSDPGDNNLLVDGTIQSTGEIHLDDALNHDGTTVGFYGVAPVTKGAGLTAQLTTITHTAPGTPDYAIQDLVLTGYGFVTKDEGNSVLAVIANLQTRMAQIEARLGSSTGVGLFT